MILQILRDLKDQKGEKMKAAVIIIDITKEAVSENSELAITRYSKEIIPKINRLTKYARVNSIPVIFSMDSFMRGDFIFQGRLKEKSIRGTSGAEVADDLDQSDSDMYVPKRRFSAFFKTDLDQTLRLYRVDTVIVTGISSHWCVLNTVMDALANDFRVYVIEDCCAAYKHDVHRAIMDIYRKSSLYPLLQIVTLEQYLNKGDRFILPNTAIIVA